MSILPSPPVRLPQEGEAVRRVERESERQESGRHDLPEREKQGGGAEEEQNPDVEVDVSEDYAAEHPAQEPEEQPARVTPGPETAPHQIDIEA